MKVQKTLAGNILNCSKKRIRFAHDKLEEIKEAITKHDIKLLIGKKTITKKPEKGVSRARARKILRQKRKGRQRGRGSIKGTQNARANTKSLWMQKVRKQRAFLKKLVEKDMIERATYRDLYQKVSGNYFRNVRHIKLYIEEHKLVKQDDQ